MALDFAAEAQGVLDMNAPPVGNEAGTFMIRARAIGVIPEDNSSSISAIGGHVTATAQAAPELDFSYFVTDRAITAARNLSVTPETAQSAGDRSDRPS